MGHLNNALFVILWFAVGVFVLRYFFGGYFRERGRAEIAAVAVIVAFAAGAYWPFSERIHAVGVAAPSDATSAAPSDAVAPAPSDAAAPAAPSGSDATDASMRDLSALCRAAKAPQAGGVGSLDILRAGGADGTDFESGAAVGAKQALSLLGWAAAAGALAPASGVCLIVDGRVVTSASVRYGGPRADVVAAFRRNALLNSAFEVDLAPGTLHAGTHTIRIGALSANGLLQTIAGERVVTVR